MPLSQAAEKGTAADTPHFALSVAAASGDAEVVRMVMRMVEHGEGGDGGW